MLNFYLIIIQFIGIVLSNNASWIPYANKSYLIVQDRVNHTIASSRCSDLNGQLAIVYNESLQTVLEENINMNYSCNVSAYWIGLYDDSPNNDRRFLNITPTYRNWNGEKHTDKEYCVSMGHPTINEESICKFPWYSIPCDSVSNVLPGYICEKGESSPDEQSYSLTTTSYETTSNNKTSFTDDKSNSATFVATVISLVVLIILSLFLFVGFNCWKDIKLEKKLRNETKTNTIGFREEETKESTKTSPEKGNYVLAKDVGNTLTEQSNIEKESSQNNSSEVENNVDASKLE